MAVGVSFYEKDNSYKLLFKWLVDKYGNERATVIYNYATTDLNQLLARYSMLSKGERQHTDRFIFPRISMYRAMLNELGNEAMPIMDKLIFVEGTKVGKLLGHITKFPFMKQIFLKIFASMAKKQFGKKNGFEQIFYTSPRHQVRFDIIKCPYCKYCTLCGCPELTHTFCDSDSYCFTNLTKMSFVREQTLAKGEKCDFSLTIKK